MWLHLHMDSHEISKRTKQKQTRGYREQIDGGQMEGGREQAEKREGIKKYKLVAITLVTGMNPRPRECNQ